MRPSTEPVTANQERIQEIAGAVQAHCTGLGSHRRGDRVVMAVEARKVAGFGLYGALSLTGGLGLGQFRITSDARLFRA